MENLSKTNQDQSSSSPISGFLLGTVLGAAVKDSKTITKYVTNGTQTYGILKNLDVVLLSLSEPQLIMFMSKLSKLTYLSSLSRLDSDLKNQKDKRSLSHLIVGASKGLKTPYIGKALINIGQKGLFSSVLMESGLIMVKSIKNADSISPAAPGALLSYGVSDVLSTIFDSDQSNDVIAFQSHRRIGSHRRFYISVLNTVVECLAIQQNAVTSFDELMSATDFYYAYLISELSNKTKAAIFHPQFVLNTWINLSYRADGYGFVSNFKQLYNI